MESHFHNLEGNDDYQRPAAEQFEAPAFANAPDAPAAETRIVSQTESALDAVPQPVPEEGHVSSEAAEVPGATETRENDEYTEPDDDQELYYARWAALENSRLDDGPPLDHDLYVPGPYAEANRYAPNECDAVEIRVPDSDDVYTVPTTLYNRALGFSRLAETHKQMSHDCAAFAFICSTGEALPDLTGIDTSFKMENFTNDIPAAIESGAFSDDPVGTILFITPATSMKGVGQIKGEHHFMVRATTKDDGTPVYLSQSGVGGYVTLSTLQDMVTLYQAQSAARISRIGYHGSNDGQ